ncbi:deoxyribodipyrimidine photolyase-related protein [Mameliella alba]|uniref:cryptochrome/photolyase family protein n=1 Tax=Mameliella alba TaxID=561184 RepID=UPI000881AABE|nr:cryptochrome/photolyase family protein [Mameliella alba]PTR37969.1 deoxyribodipyrimidine photolyase-related protein [Mameliella alba]GGF67094.1 deoxyribodipyrimidine photo-lyase [Mameliella alba]SDD54113.1 deoxyribodipyrimidine photolyase-related protein [Mameliella alba]
MSRLILVLGDQLSEGLAALKAADKAHDVVVMAEVADETAYVPHHPKKIALILAGMRKFAARLREDGWEVRYTELDDTQNAGSICGELLRRAEETGATEVIATEPGEWRLINALRHCPLKVRLLEDDRFIASHAMFDNWAKGRKALWLEYFYREMRRKTSLLMEGDDPAGGQWNFDHDNRKPAPDAVTHRPIWFEPDAVTEDVLDLVEARFPNNFGKLRPFGFATDRAQAQQALAHFIDHALPRFGDYQDAMLDGNRFLYHSLLSGYMNIGLLDPLEVCQAVEKAYENGDVPINAAEGFIRQIIGWREYVRGIYFREGPEYPGRNVLKHKRKLPWFYWSAETDMRCVAKAVEQTRDEAYAHHIQRLMVTGNFGLLAGVDPQALHEWYLSVYIDAFEWVEAPNTVGMSQFADGGIIASKPYVSSGNYINKMSDHCKPCAYSVTAKTGENACPFNLLYWHFMDRHRDRFEGNPRMAQMYRTFDRMDPDKRETILREAQDFLDRMEAGERV